MVVYHIPDEKGLLKKYTDTFDCMENELIVKTFTAIRTRAEGVFQLPSLNNVYTPKSRPVPI